MSPRAACRLEQLGFGDVADYAGGKMDWLARSLPYEGEADLVARHLVAASTCYVDETVDAVVSRLGTRGACVVVSTSGVVVGVLDAQARDHNPGAVVGAVMHSGPTTVRPSAERGVL